MKHSSKQLIFGAICFASFASSGFCVEVHVALVKSGTNFSYTVFNDEPVRSAFHLDTFHLPVNASITVVSNPPGWSVDTDNLTYVNWFSSNSLAPFTNDIAPATSKSGFVISSSLPPELPTSSESFVYTLTSWDHAATNSGTSGTGLIEVPSIVSVAPVFASQAVSNMVYRCKLLGVPNYSYAVLSSTNLQTWTVLSTNFAPISIAETNMKSAPIRFFKGNFVSTNTVLQPD